MNSPIGGDDQGSLIAEAGFKMQNMMDTQCDSNVYRPLNSLLLFDIFVPRKESRTKTYMTNGEEEQDKPADFFGRACGHRKSEGNKKQRRKREVIMTEYSEDVDCKRVIFPKKNENRRGEGRGRS